MERIKLFFTQLFCKHKFVQESRMKCTYLWDDETPMDTSITFYSCSKCGKRVIAADQPCYYKPQLVEKLNLWLKGELDIIHF